MTIHTARPGGAIAQEVHNRDCNRVTVLRVRPPLGRYFPRRTTPTAARNLEIRNLEIRKYGRRCAGIETNHLSASKAGPSPWQLVKRTGSANDPEDAEKMEARRNIRGLDRQHACGGTTPWRCYTKVEKNPHEGNRIIKPSPFRSRRSIHMDTFRSSMIRFILSHGCVRYKYGLENLPCTYFSHFCPCVTSNWRPSSVHRLGDYQQSLVGHSAMTSESLSLFDLSITLPVLPRGTYRQVDIHVTLCQKTICINRLVSAESNAHILRAVLLDYFGTWHIHLCRWPGVCGSRQRACHKP